MSDRSFIETQFPIAQLSAESYKERKANLGQTLTRLGKWWGRKPLVLVRASILGLLMPASSDSKKDRDIFLKLMTMDADALWRRRKGKLNDTDLMKRASEFKEVWRSTPKDARDELREEIWDSLSDEDRVALNASRRFKYTREEFDRLPYDERAAECVRPEEIDGPDEDAWQEINAHLRTSARTLAELVEQLGVRRFGHRPRVGDCFCGGGSIPFEAARIGAEVFASDLNPVAGLLTWASLNVIGGGRDVQARVRSAQDEAYRRAEEQIAAWGIEHNERGWRAEAFLYCIEVRPQGCEYAIPLAPSWIIGERSLVIAKLMRAGQAGTLGIEIVTNPSDKDWVAAKNGTIANSRILDPLDPTRSWAFEEVRGAGGLRMWEAADLVPRPSDALQERLYCIRWVTPDGDRVYAAPTPKDLEREAMVLRLLKERLTQWQSSGFIPEAPIPEGGYNTDQPIRARGWTYWHHLFAPRQLLVNGLLAASSVSVEQTEEVAAMLSSGKVSDWNSRLSGWMQHKGNEKGNNTFNNQALNPLFNYAVRPLSKLTTSWQMEVRSDPAIPRGDKGLEVDVADARDIIDRTCDLWITDPPYADAVNYHELADFFLAWYQRRLAASFPGWTVDARQALAVRGTDDAFRRSMVDVYSNLARHMPDNGLQVVMFTHQNAGVWADLGMILWAAGLRVSAAWTIATETPTGGLRKGNYVQGTVLLVLRKRLNEEHGFLDEVYPMVEDEVRRQIDSMRALDDGGEPNFGDTDYQLAAYAAALRVLTQFQTLDGQDISHELFRAQENGRNVEKSRFEQVIDRGIEIACDYLVPRGLDAVWRGLTPDERLYLRALDVESRGEHRQGVYQELARGFGVREFRPLLHASTANSTRMKTPGEFGRSHLSGDGFGGTQLRQVLFAIHTTHASEAPDAGLRYLKDELANYWGERQRIIAILDWLAELGRGDGMEHWLAGAEAARLLAGRLRGDHG